MLCNTVGWAIFWTSSKRLSLGGILGTLKIAVLSLHSVHIGFPLDFVNARDSYQKCLHQQLWVPLLGGVVQQKSDTGFPKRMREEDTRLS